jgi:predicted transcriptional regulator
MGNTHISFRTEESKCSELDKLAESMDRDRSWVINEAIDSYLELHRWQLERIEKGIAASKAGRTLSTEEVLQRIEDMIAETKARKAIMARK